MNAIASTILWVSAQVALFSLVGCAAFVLLRRRGPSAAVTAAVIVLVATLALSLAAVSPWPHWQLKSEISNPKSETISKQEIQKTENSAAGTTILADARAGDTESTLAVWYQAARDWYQAQVSAEAAQAAAKPAWHYWLPALRPAVV